MAHIDQHRTAATSADGQPDAGERLVRAFNELRDELISTLLFVLGNREDAHDAAQEAFVKCWGARGQLHEVRNLRAWIFRVCFNTAKDMQRSAWNRRAKPLQGEQSLMMANQYSPASGSLPRMLLMRALTES